MPYCFLSFALKYSGRDPVDRLVRLTVNDKVATALGSIPASSDTVESEGRQMKQCWKKQEKLLIGSVGMRKDWHSVGLRDTDIGEPKQRPKAKKYEILLFQYVIPAGMFT